MVEPDEEETVRAARARRAERARALDRRDAGKRAMKYTAVAVGAAILIAAGVWGYQFLPDAPKNVHNHAVFLVYTDGQVQSFQHCAFDLNGCQGFAGTNYMRGHMHYNDGKSIIHIEGLEGLTLERFFESLRVDFNDDSVKFDDVIHGGRNVRNNETHAWQFWLDRCADGANNWEKQNGMAKYQPKQHDRMLFTFAPSNATQETLAPQLNAVPTDADIGAVTKDTCA